MISPLSAQSSKTRRAFSLIEIICAIVLSSVLATAVIVTMRRPNDSAGRESCLAERISLQQEVDRFAHDFGRMPRNQMAELVVEGYWQRIAVRRDGEPDRPLCPQSRRPYVLRNGDVTCPLHGGVNH